MSKEKRYRAAIIQDGIEVASVIASSPENTERGIIHYAAVYGRDGPVEIVRSPALRRWLNSP